MKNKFFAILLSAILLVTMIPFAFASSADSVDEGIVQGEDDTVIIMETNSFGTTMSQFQAATKKAPKTGRTIFVLTYNCQMVHAANSKDPNQKYNFICGAGWQDATLVFTSKVKLTNLDKVYTTSTYVSDNTPLKNCELVDQNVYHADDVLNYFDNENTTSNVTLTSPDVSICWWDAFCKTEFDYLNFRCGNTNYFFYANFFDITFGEHFNITPYGTSAAGYPSILNGYDTQARSVRTASAWAGKEADAAYFTKTQTITVLGGTWAYITPTGRTSAVTINGEINLIMKNVVTKTVANLASNPNGTVMVGRDATEATARINVTAQDCTFAQFAFFSSTSSGGNARTISGQLTVTLNGTNTFPRGIENFEQTAKNTFDAAFLAGAALTLNVNGTVTLGSGKTIDGIDNGTLQSTVNYNGIYTDANSMLNFDVMNDTADYTGYETDANGAIVYVNTNIPAASCGSGKSAESPVRILDQAFRALKGIGTGGTIVLADGCWFPDANLPTLAGDVIITAADPENQLLVPMGVLEFHNNVTFRNVNFAKTGNIKVFFMYDHDLAFENCGFYENAGGYEVGHPPVKGAASAESTIAVSTAPRVNTTNDAAKDGRVIDQTITVTGNADGFTLHRIAAGYKANQHLADTYIAEDTSTDCTGEVNIVVGENASVKIIDAVSENNFYAVNVTLPAEQIGDLELRSTNDAGTASTVIYTDDAANVQTWLKADSGYAVKGYSLRAANTSGKFAMRAGFTAPAGTLDGAVEYGVLVKRHENPNALAWFDNGYAYGITEAPAAQTYNKGVGKSVVYLNPVLDNADKTTLAEDGRYLFSCPVVFTTLNDETADYEYTFTPYIAYEILADGAQSFYYAYGTDENCTIAASLYDMIDVVGGSIADAIAAEIDG